MRHFIACNIQKYGECGFNPLEAYDFKAENTTEARHWVINHLDCSIKWQIVGGEKVTT